MVKLAESTLHYLFFHHLVQRIHSLAFEALGVLFVSDHQGSAAVGARSEQRPLPRGELAGRGTLPLPVASSKGAGEPRLYQIISFAISIQRSAISNALTNRPNSPEAPFLLLHSHF